MAYVEEIQINDVQSGMQNIRQEFSHLSFDTYHEANYGMEKIYSLQESIKLGVTYDKGDAIRTNYLDSGLTTEGDGIGSFSSRLKEYLPQSVVDVLPK